MNGKEKKKMIIREPIFQNEGETVEIVFAYSEEEIYGNPHRNIPKGVFSYDGWSCGMFYSQEFKQWLEEKVGAGNYHLSYCMGYRLRFRNKADAVRFRLEWN